MIPHKDTKTPLKNFVVPVDEIEKLTGIDFFTSLEDKVENQLEASSATQGWKF